MSDIDALLEPGGTVPAARRRAAERLASRSRGIAERWLEAVEPGHPAQDAAGVPDPVLAERVVRAIAAALARPRPTVGASGVLIEAVRWADEAERGGLTVQDLLHQVEALIETVGAAVAEAVDEDRELLVALLTDAFRLIARLERTILLHALAEADARKAARLRRLEGLARQVDHEVRNEVHSMSSAASMLTEAFVLDDPELRDRFARMTRTAADRVGLTLGNLVELAVVDRSRSELRRRGLEECVHRTVHELETAAHQAGVEVRVGPLPAVEVPAGTVELALRNLVGNAIKYHDPEKGGRWVEVSAELPGGDPPTVEIRVRDNGVGIPAEDRPHIFSSGYRSRAVRSSVEGRGLGLPLVQEAVERLGGSVALADDPDAETVFVCTLPVHEPTS